MDRSISPPDPSCNRPALEEYENPVARAKFAAVKNPGLGKQQSSAFYAITVGDLRTLKQMAENGWCVRVSG